MLPTTSILERASGCFQNVGKNCVDSRGEYVEVLTCESKRLAIMVLKKISPGHI
jgi:hypothetical protein